MSTPPATTIAELTAEARHEHATSLQREVGQLRIVKEGLKARVKDLEARIADLQQRLERGVTANQVLRVENAGLRAIQAKRTQLVVDATLRKVGAL